MAQSAIDTSEKSFGIFLNSNQSASKSIEKSNVNIPIQGNLSEVDPAKSTQISLTSMLFTNTIYNITAENNLMNVLIYYAVGRGFDGPQEEIRTVEIPIGFYNITTLSNFLSRPGILGEEITQQLFRYGVVDSYCNIFEGFGAIPNDPSDPTITKAAPTNDSNTKILFSSPDLAHMIQYGTDINTAVDESSNLRFSYVYAGIYLECPLNDTRYSPLLAQLGYFNIETIPAPEIALSAPFGRTRRGYGMAFTAHTAKPEGIGIDAYDNTTYYTLAEPDQRLLNNSNADKNNILQASISFHGIVPVSGVILTCFYETKDPTAADPEIITIDNGYFVNGASITVPAPYIVGFQDCRFQNIEFIENSYIVTINILLTGAIAVGMSIGPNYNEQGEVYLEGLLYVERFDYAQGTVTIGSENTNAYCITEIMGGGLYRMNIPWTHPNATIDDVEFIGTVYVVTTTQVATPSLLSESMLASPKAITDLAGLITPLNVTNLAGVDEIHVHCTQLRTSNLSSTLFGALAPADVIAVIPVEVEFGFKQNYQPPNPLTSYLNNTNITVLNIQLTDPRGRLLDFNGVDWSMTFFCTEVPSETATQLNAGGVFNTPFQDQMNTMEGTAQAEMKIKGKRREITFFDSNQNGKRGGGNIYGRF